MARSAPPPEELEVVLGRRVRSVRIAQQLTQAEVADLANVSVGALKHLEAGSGATVRTLVRVLRALDEASWVETLGPPPAPAFNPLDLLDARRSEDRPTARRVRRDRRPKPTVP